MALELQDLMALQSMDKKSELTPYEQYKVGYMQSKKPSGVAIAGLTVASVAAAAGISAWIFGGMQASAKGKEAKEAAYAAKEVAATQYNAALQLMNQQNQNTQANLDRLISTVAAERAERIAGDVTMSQNITDTISGQQSAAQSQATSVESSAYATAMNQIVSDRLTGRSSLDAQPVCIYSAPQPCSCPGCGCNG
jgi:uncharacterized protein HemX